jgi:hypothetical protein
MRRKILPTNLRNFICAELYFAKSKYPLNSPRHRLVLATPQPSTAGPNEF